MRTAIRREVWFLFAMAFAGRVDRVVAVIDDRVVLESDLRLDAALEQLDTAALPFWSSYDPEERQIAATVVAVVAGDVALYRPHEAAVRRRLDTLRQAFAERAQWLAFLERWGLDEGAMLEVLRKRMRVEAYLRRNVRPDPTEPGFMPAVEALLDELRARVRVRRIEVMP